ncbi:MULTISPECIES: hypothetical protein [unclassified Anabaena]|uniref:hypothetical protein n=1 Tax=unclassified Anabaena TaxID=2619674 RepID=UPI000829CB6E|nr:MULTISPECIES: hypothetical protein [unclassified Anabaena]
MKPDNFYTDCNLAREMALIHRSHDLATSISDLIAMKYIKTGISTISQGLTTEPRLCVWQTLSTLTYLLLLNYLILLFNVVIRT